MHNSEYYKKAKYENEYTVFNFRVNLFRDILQNKEELAKKLNVWT